MSTGVGVESNVMSRCAACGVTEDDNGGDVKLKNCTACHLVKYCGVKCQKEHRKKHKRACKQRAAELRDEILFRQPEESYLGDCPICFLPLSIDVNKSVTLSCCSKIICLGCEYANQKREIEQKLVLKCAFCRTPLPETQTEGDKRLKERAEMNDTVALTKLGTNCRKAGDYQTAIQYWSKAAELGDAHSQYHLASMYYHGHGVEKDRAKAVHHYEQAAMRGQPDARHNLGAIDMNKGHRERAVKHWIIAAKLGYDMSLELLKEEYRNGVVSKDDLTAALRGHQAALDAMKSPQRDEAEAALN